MANNYIFSSTTGVIIPDTSDIKQTVQAEYVNAFTPYGELNIEDSTPQGRLIDVETEARSSVITFNAEIANTLINIYLASGDALDAHGANYGIYRNEAIPTTVAVTVTGVANTVIPANSQAIDVNGIIWVSESEIIIGSSGSASGTFKCSKTGAIALATGELNKIVASGTLGVDGWETVINTANATPGRDIEPDSEYKLRILQGIFTGSAVFGNYASNALKVDGVRDVFTYDNPEGSGKVLDNITIPAHSVYACVAGGNSADVAYALYEVKSGGCGWCGNTTVTVTDKTYGTKNTVTYQTPSNVNISVTVNATNILNSNADLSGDIKTVITNYFNNDYENEGYAKVGIRAVIDPFIIAALIQSQISGITVNSVSVGLTTPSARATVEIIKASVTEGITWASVVASTFSSEVSATNGRYNFIYDNNHWKLNNNNVTLSDYGITVTGTPVNGDKISVLFATGNVATSAVPLYANEIPVISTSNITVTINE